MTKQVESNEASENRRRLEEFLQLASRNRLIAQRLHVDLSSGSSEVILHILRAWRALDSVHAILEGDEDSAANVPPECFPVADLVFPDGLSDEEFREDLKRFVETEEIPGASEDDLVTHEQLRLHCDLLCRAELVSQRAVYGPSLIRRVVARHRATAFKILAGLIVMQVAVWIWRGPDPWRAVFFDEPEIGKEFVREGSFRELHFDWSKQRPMFGFQLQNYAVRFDSCLRVDEPGEVKFSLGSDDGSRMFLNGDKVIDRWGASPYYRKDYALQSTGGLYHLQVDFMQLSGASLLDLDITINDKPLDKVSSAYLIPPTAKESRVSCK